MKPKTKHPFGNGPWVCRNPAAEHYGVNVIDHLQTYNNKGSLVGSFSCKCGYVYTRGVNPQGAIGPPRFRQGGPLHTDLLQRSVMKGESLRGLARLVGLDPKTVVRILKTAGIPVNSVMAPNASPIMSTAKTDLDTPVCKRQPTNRKPRVDWDALDRSMANDVKGIVCRIQEETPPRRAAFAAIEMQLCKRGYVLTLTAHRNATAEQINAYRNVEDGYANSMAKYGLAKISPVNICGSGSGRKAVITASPELLMGSGYAVCGGHYISADIKVKPGTGVDPSLLFDDLMPLMLPLIGAK